MPSNAEMDALRQLHAIDVKIDKLTSQKDLLPVSLRRIEAHLAQQRQALEDKRGRIKQLRAKAHAKETDLRAAEQEAEKLTVQLNQAHTNKEYTAFQHEIAAKKADGSRLEDEILATMGDVEELESDASDLERSITQLERQQAEEAKGVAGEVARLDAEIDTLRNARQAAARRVEAALLDEYERIAAKKGPSALAPVVGNSCQGCFMTLPPQLCQVLRGTRKVIKCPSCSRLLYLP